MPDSATLEIILRDKGGAPSGPPQQPSPQTPNTGPANLGQPTGTTSGPSFTPPRQAPQAAGTATQPLKEVLFGPGTTPPPIRRPNIPDPAAPQAPQFAGLGPQADALKKTMGTVGGGFQDLLGKIPASVKAIAGVGLAFEGMRIVAGATQRSLEFLTKIYRQQTDVEIARLGNDFRAVQIAELRQTRATDLIPLIGPILEKMREADIAAVEREQKRVEGLIAKAQSFIPFSGPVATGFARAEITKLREQQAEAKILGPAIGPFIADEARLQAAMSRINAIGTRNRLEGGLGFRKQNEADLAELAAKLAESNKVADRERADQLKAAVEKSIAGDPSNLYDLIRKNTQAIRDLQADMAKTSREKPLGWLQDVLRGGLVHLPVTVDGTQFGKAGAGPAAIAPMFGPQAGGMGAGGNN